MRHGTDIQPGGNPIDRFSIGDRTPGLATNPDGSLDIDVQSTEPAGPASNWLPSPANGLFRLNHRIYLPEVEPKIQRHSVNPYRRSARKPSRYCQTVTVGEQVQASLDHWSTGEWRSAMWHASAALQETAAKRYPWLDPGPGFRRTVRDDIDIFTALAAPDIDFAASRFPVPVVSDTAEGHPDMADLLYGVHRFLHEDENALAAGCTITPHADGVPMFEILRGRLSLRGSAALGLLGIAVFAAENKDEQIPETYMLGWRQHVFHVYGWWGWQNHFRHIVSLTPITQYPLDFAEEWDNWAPVG